MTILERILLQDYSVLNEITLVELKELEPLFETESDSNKYVYKLMLEAKTEFDEMQPISEYFEKMSSDPIIKDAILEYEKNQIKRQTL